MRTSGLRPIQAGLVPVVFCVLLAASGSARSADGDMVVESPAAAMAPGTALFAGDPRPYQESPYAHSMDRGLKFVLLDKDPERFMHLAVLDYLQRKFGLGQRFSISRAYDPDIHIEVNTKDMAAFGRLTTPFHRYTPGDTGEVRDFVKAMVVGLYSDRFPPPPDYVTRLRGELEANRGKGGMHDYAVTHHALAFHWMVENNVAWNYEGSKGLRPEFANAMVEIITRNGPDKDISYEAMAFLQYMGFRSMVKQEWIEAVAAAQRPDGGWGYKPDTGPSHGHPTVLALWALLEHALPDVPAVTWVQRTEDDINSTSGKSAPAETPPAETPPADTPPADTPPADTPAAAPKE